jgi:polar amino acid transport system substrate-binding protein
MRYLIRAFWALVCALLPCMALAQTTTITVAAEDDWAPYSSMKADGSGPEGFSPDLVRAVFKLKGVEVKFVTVPFARCLHLVKTGKVVACFDTTITDENKNEFYFHTTPIFEDGLAIFALSDFAGNKLTSRELEGSTVGITTGYTYPTDVMQNQKIKKFEANSDDQLLKMLLAKRVQFVLLNTLPGALRIKNTPAFVGKVKQVGAVSKDGFWLNFSKAHPDGKRMSELFETALLEFKASGQYDKLQKDFRQRLGVAR